MTEIRQNKLIVIMGDERKAREQREAR